MTKREIAEMTVQMMFDVLPDSKKKVFENACYRNYLLTSWTGLGFSRLHIYKEGFYLEMDGTRSRFTVFTKDNDGELEVMKKPNEDKLHKIWEAQWLNEMPKAFQDYLDNI